MIPYSILFISSWSIIQCSSFNPVQINVPTTFINLPDNFLSAIFIKKRSKKCILREQPTILINDITYIKLMTDFLRDHKLNIYSFREFHRRFIQQYINFNDATHSNKLLKNEMKKMYKNAGK